MGILSTTTKVRVAAKGAKGLARSPRARRMTLRAAGAAGRTGATAGRLGIKAAKPVAKRRARRRAAELGDTARTVGEALIVYLPQAMQELGLIEVEEPKPRRTMPAMAAGMAIGAGAMYLLEPEHGSERRRKVLELVS